MQHISHGFVNKGGLGFYCRCSMFLSKNENQAHEVFRQHVYKLSGINTQHFRKD